VAHEALLREWPRLRSWLEEDRDGRRLHRHLTEAATAWAAERRDPGALYRGTRLGAAQDFAAAAGLAALNATEREFLDASAVAQQQELLSARRTARRLRSLAVAMAVFLVVALVAGGVALVQRSRANHQATTARQAKTSSDATALAGEARALPTDQLALALLLAVQSRRIEGSTTTDGAVEAVLSHVPPGVETQVPLREVNVLTATCCDASPDGRLLAAGGTDGTARIYDATTGTVVETLPGHRGVTMQTVQFNADGTKLVGSDEQNDVYVWDLASGRQILGALHTAPVGITRVMFSGDSRIVTATILGEVRVWDISSPAHPVPMGTPYSGSRPPGASPLPPWTFLAPGGHLLAIEHAGKTDVWNIVTHTPAYPALPGAAIGESPDGSTLATADGDRVLLWDVATGQSRGPALDGFKPGGFGSVLFSPHGRFAAIPSTTPDTVGTVSVVDLQFHRTVGNPVPGQTLRYLNDGRIAIGVGQTIELWQPGVTTPVPFATPLAGAGTLGVEHWLSPTKVYRLPADTGLAILGVPAAPPSLASEQDASTGKVVGDLLGAPQPSAPFQSASIVNPAGTLAALAHGDNVELWDIGRGLPTVVFDPSQKAPVAAWDPVAPILATTGNGGSLALWDTSDRADPKLLVRTTLQGYPSTAFAHFSPDGRTLAVQGWDSSATTLVSVPDLHVMHTFTANEFGDGVLFTSDSKTVAVADINFTANALVEFRDVQTGARRAVVAVPYPEFSSMALVDGDKLLVTVQSAQLRGPKPDDVISRVDLWDVSTDRPVGEPIMVNGDAGMVEVDRPGGFRLVSSTSTNVGTDMVWDFNPADWPMIACRLAGRNLTQDEWKQYLPGRPYEVTCPQWPAGS
jgi:WD40 repeat protein